MVLHVAKKRKSTKKVIPDSVDMSKCEERSWIQRRTCELIKELDPSCNNFTSQDWSGCYWQAKKEMDAREEEKVNQSEEGGL